MSIHYNVEVRENGTVFWRDAESKFHRIDGPAIEHANGSKYWYIDGKLHRVDGPAIERANGTKEWFVDGERHRTDGPAIEYYEGSKVWWVDNKLHRIDGPAYEDSDGSKEWWVDGMRLSKTKFTVKVKELALAASHSCHDKVVEIDGKKYRLTAV